MDAIQGDTASAAEKGADFDGGGFLGDGTKIQPALNQIWKAGHVVKRATYSTYDVEDMDATYQSRLNPSTKDDGLQMQELEIGLWPVILRHP